MGCVIVEFLECREVFCDGKSQGNSWNDEDKCRVLIIGNGVHTFRLGGNENYAPVSQSVEVTGEGNVILPQRIVFTKKA
jgi:hypothetical protein